AATASIPDGTTISGPSGWDGTIAPPTSGSFSGTAPSGYVAGGTVISVGSGDSTLVFSNPVTILLTGVTTGAVGYKPAGSDTWTVINGCGGSYDNPTPPASPGACVAMKGSDAKILTYHFTTFGSLAFQNSSSNSNSGGGGGGGGAIAIVPNNTVTTPTTTTTPAPATAAQGQVLGAAVYNFAKNLGVGSRGADVTALQQYLLDNGFSIPAGATGYYGAQTRAAVIAFQKAHGIEQAGVVGPQTRAELNKGVVATTPETTPVAAGKTNLTAGQASAIIGFLQSFDADPSIIANVKAVLGL
ncbi:MAG TPA: peptidoglycan-binding domain-containing protein, partial [Candidatus Paceibacterota bacterium]